MRGADVRTAQLHMNTLVGHFEFDDENDGAEWLIVTAGTGTPETATCTTFDACDPTSTTDSLE